jgi:hypothetical protein
MNNREKRIKLAEAMGYKCSGCDWREMGGKLGSKWWMAVLGCPVHEFKPHKDANDDYAVLEWLRAPAIGDDQTDEDWHQWTRFVSEMHDIPRDRNRPGIYSAQTIYQIGDYARAALKVIE